MTIQYEDIYPSFLSLPYDACLSIIRDIRTRRNSFVTPKRVKKAITTVQRKRSTRRELAYTLLDQMTDAEKAELLKTIGD
jgi:hypothetical protein